LTKFSIGWGKLNEIIFIENKVENKGNWWLRSSKEKWDDLDIESKKIEIESGVEK
jgi:hypothetical protein